MKPTHMASSDSSSSESGESSDSGSESDSDNERDRQKNEKAGYTDPDNQAANVSSQQVLYVNTFTHQQSSVLVEFIRVL